MRILIDMDSIAVDLCSRWFDTHNLETGDALEMSKVLSWDTHEFITRGDAESLYGILTRPGFYDFLPPLPGAIEGITALAAAGHSVRFCTATPGADAARAKMQWVDRHFRHLGWRGHKHVIMTHEKSWVRADALIDDSPANLMKFPGETVAIEYPYNRDVPASFHAHDYRDTVCAWSQIVSYFNERSE